MKFISRNVTVHRYTFGKFDLTTKTVSETTIIETAEELSDRKISGMSKSYGQFLGRSSEEVEIKLPLDLLVDINRVYKSAGCAEFCARPDGSYYFEEILPDDNQTDDE